MSDDEIEITCSSTPTFTCKTIKRLNSDYVEIDGEIYERLVGKTENIDLDLDADVVTFLDELVESGKYVNKQDAIRTPLRRAIEEGLTIKDGIKVDVDGNPSPYTHEVTGEDDNS